MSVPVAFPTAATPVPAWAVAWAAPPPPTPPPLPTSLPPHLFALFAGLVLVCTPLVHLFGLVTRRGCELILDSLVAAGEAHEDAKKSAIRPWEKLLGYYTAIVAIFAVFLTATFSSEQSEWALLADLQYAPLLVQRSLEYTSWLLLAPALALLQGLAGQIFFPACVVVTPPAIPAEAKGEDGSTLPILFWRIVTRGLHPDLVAANVCDAFEVLEHSDLPRARWAVEVVTDHSMDLSARTRTEVVEIVVPKDYKPPNGCKFKARALHYAATNGASAARRQDWIVHVRMAALDLSRDLMCRCMCE